MKKAVETILLDEHGNDEDAGDDDQPIRRFDNDDFGMITAVRYSLTYDVNTYRHTYVHTLHTLHTYRHIYIHT